MFKQLSLKLAVLASFSFFSSAISAQSTVYFFTKTITSAETMITKNGKDLFELRGPEKSRVEPIAMSGMKMASISYSPAYKKCIFNDEGKVLFGINYDFTNVKTLEISHLKGEIQLNLAEGSIHYVQVAPKGLFDIQFKELSEKEALKLLKNKKYVELPEYTE